MVYSDERELSGEEKPACDWYPEDDVDDGKDINAELGEYRGDCCT